MMFIYSKTPLTCRKIILTGILLSSKEEKQRKRTKKETHGPVWGQNAKRLIREPRTKLKIYVLNWEREVLTSPEPHTINWEISEVWNSRPTRLEHGHSPLPHRDSCRFSRPCLPICIYTAVAGYLLSQRTLSLWSSEGILWRKRPSPHCLATHQKTPRNRRRCCRQMMPLLQRLTENATNTMDSIVRLSPSLVAVLTASSNVC